MGDRGAIYDVKRLIGRAFEEESIRELREQLLYKIEMDQDKIGRPEIVIPGFQ